jgi:FAS-associated factor 2
LLSVVPTASQLPWVSLGFAACKNEALQSNALLLVYVYSPLHRDSDKVAATFCREEITSMLSQTHLVCLGVSIHSAQGAQLAQLLGATTYPVVAILQPSRGSNTMEVVLKIQGPVLVNLSVGALVGHLQSSLQRHQQVTAELETRRLLREQESELRAEQDAEYQATLRADQERQRAQQEERNLLERQAQEEQAAILKEQEVKENRLGDARKLLKDEPTEGSIVQIRFAMPSGRKVVRKFGANETVHVLRAFLMVHFHDTDLPEMPNIGLSTSFPKKSYNAASDESLTLQEADLAPQAVLMVQDLDA